jgi:integrase
VKDPTTGRKKEIFKVLPEADATTALGWLHKERARIRAGVVLAESPKKRFYEFAESLLEHKVRVGEIKSAKNKKHWGYILEHLIEGVEGPQSKKFVEGFGDFYIDRIHSTHVEKWKAEVGDLIAAGDYSPTTANGWLRVLRVIMRAAKRQFRLPELATEDVTNFDMSEVSTYTEEEPNSLEPSEVPVFLETLRRDHPQHFAMVFLGLVTGLRPSSLRPLRRKGSEVDVLWDKSKLLVRRSQTLGNDVMRTTKQKKRYSIDLPEEALKVLEWHVETQLVTPEQQDSDLLFPALTGGFRASCLLNKPLADVAATMGLGKRFTQRGLRRTFQDLARAANVEAVVTRSISGHATEQMQHHYSTVNGGEQRQALAKVIHLTRASGEHSGEHAQQSGEHKEKAG